MIIGTDFVKEPLRFVAAGALSFSQEEVKLNAQAIECPTDTEPPKSGFRSCPGRINQWESPEGPGVRVDSHCYSGYLAPPCYGLLLADLSTRGEDRWGTIERVQYALQGPLIFGIDAALPFHQFTPKNPHYLSGEVDTRWVEDILLKEYGNRKGISVIWDAFTKIKKGG
jgi:acetyl-CoA carboxylase biotin carboxylase subunit